MTATELRQIVNALAVLLTHGAQCRALNIGMPDVALLSSLALKCEHEAAAQETATKPHLEKPE